MKRKTRAGRKPDPAVTNEGDFVDLQLYVTDKTPRCLAAYENIQNICEEYATGMYHFTVMDLQIRPDLARTDDISAFPTLVRVPSNLKRRKIIGMLTDTKKVIEALGLPERPCNYHTAGAI